MVGANLKDSNAKECLQFLARLGADHQVTALRQAISRDFSLYTDCPAIGEWLKTNTEALIQRR